MNMWIKEWMAAGKLLSIHVLNSVQPTYISELSM